MKEILEIFVCCLEICIPYWWTGKLAEKRELRRGIKVLWNICLLIWIGLLYYQRIFSFYSRLYVLLEIAVAVLLAGWRYRIRWRDAFAIAGIFYESLYFLYLMTLIAVEYSDGYDAMMQDTVRYQLYSDKVQSGIAVFGIHCICADIQTAETKPVGIWEDGKEACDRSGYPAFDVVFL